MKFESKETEHGLIFLILRAESATEEMQLKRFQVQLKNTKEGKSYTQEVMDAFDGEFAHTWPRKTTPLEVITKEKKT